MLPQRLLRPGRLYLIDIRIGILNRTISRDQAGGRLLTDGGNSRNIVRCISHQRFYIYKLRWSHMIFRLYVGRIIILDLRRSPGCPRHADLNFLIRQLQKIPVSRDNRNLHSLGGAPLSNRSQDIVRFIAGTCQDWNAHGGQHFLNDRDLFMEFFRHWLSRSLICLKHLVAECGIF